MEYEVMLGIMNGAGEEECQEKMAGNVMSTLLCFPPMLWLYQRSAMLS